jgi:hypothetical protein
LVLVACLVRRFRYPLNSGAKAGIRAEVRVGQKAEMRVLATKAGSRNISICLFDLNQAHHQHSHAGYRGERHICPPTTFVRRLMIARLLPCAGPLLDIPAGKSPVGPNCLEAQDFLRYRVADAAKCISIRRSREQVADGNFETGGAT